MSTAATESVSIEDAYERRLPVVCPFSATCRGRTTIAVASRQGGGSMPGAALADINPPRHPGLWYRVDCARCKQAKLSQSYTRGVRTMFEPYAEPTPAAAEVRRG